MERTAALLGFLRLALLLLLGFLRLALLLGFLLLRELLTLAGTGWSLRVRGSRDDERRGHRKTLRSECNFSHKPQPDRHGITIAVNFEVVTPTWPDQQRSVRSHPSKPTSY